MTQSLAEQGSIAETIKSMCDGSLAFTLEYGYAVHDGGKQKTFPQSAPIKQRRNENGRCTYSEHVYPDGSRLVFKFNSKTGVSLTASR